MVHLLSSATTFAFRSEVGTFTARRERSGYKRGGWYWRVYHKREGRLHCIGHPKVDLAPI